MCTMSPCCFFKNACQTQIYEFSLVRTTCIKRKKDTAEETRRLMLISAALKNKHHLVNQSLASFNPKQDYKTYSFTNFNSTSRIVVI